MLEGFEAGELFAEELRHGFFSLGAEGGGGFFGERFGVGEERGQDLFQGGGLFADPAGVSFDQERGKRLDGVVGGAVALAVVDEDADRGDGEEAVGVELFRGDAL